MCAVALAKAELPNTLSRWRVATLRSRDPDRTHPLLGTAMPAAFSPASAHPGVLAYGSSVVIRGSYAMYRNLGLYQPLAVILWRPLRRG